MKYLLRTLIVLALVLSSCSKEEEVITPPAPNKYTITITAEAGGSVSSPGGTYNEGSKITITATPDGQYLFEKWSDGSTVNPREITVTANLTLSATFIKKTYPLSVTIEGEGTVQEEVIIQGSTSETEYNAGTTVRLTATPNEGWVFAGWSGDVESDALEIEVTIEKGMAINALFTKPNLQAVYSGTIVPFLPNTTVINDGSLNLNQHDKVLATHFSFWYDESSLSQLNEWSSGRSYLSRDFNNDGYTDLFISFLSSEEEYVPFKLFLYDVDSSSYLDRSNLISNNLGQPFNRKSMSVDLNGDGFLDIITVSHPEKEEEEFSLFDILMSDGVDSWEQINIETRSRKIEGEDSGYYHGFAIGDVDLDEDVDIVMGMWHNTTEGITSYLNAGDGTFTQMKAILLDSENNWETETMSFTQELIDLNGDGCLDLIFWGKGDIVIKRGNCDGTFGPYYQQLTVDFGMDYKGLDLDNDGDKDLIVLVDDYTDNELIYVYENRSSTEAFEFIERSITPAPKFGSGYITLVDINGDDFIDIVPAGPLRGYDDLDLTDGGINPYYPNSPLILSQGGFNYNVIDYPILTPIEKIEFNSLGELTWIAAYPLIHEDASQPYDESDRRGVINEWKVYFSDAPFGDSSEPWVEHYSFDAEAVEETTNPNGETLFKLNLESIAQEGIYLRISSIDNFGIESNLSYMVRLQQE